MTLFQNRSDAGRKLAQRLLDFQDRKDVVILALPRGGIPVGYEVAVALNVQLDVFIVRKLGVPGREELAMGAIASGDVCVLNQQVIEALNIPNPVIKDVTQREMQELERRERLYRGQRPKLVVDGKVAILVDDGLATGASMRAAVAGLRLLNPSKIVIAVPAGAPETCAQLKGLVDQMICAAMPQPFYGVGAWYEDFSQVSDDEVRELLEQSAKPQPGR